jgi:hypothetical protein
LQIAAKAGPDRDRLKFLLLALRASATAKTIPQPICLKIR